jgi:putative addiction module component (TIGR02574 family)
MSDRVRALLPQLAGLTADEKELLIDYLSDEDDAEDEVLTQEEWEEAWLEEVERRMADMDSGKDVGVPWEEVKRRMKEKYG